MEMEHEVKLDRTELSMIRWMWTFTSKERKKSAELRELLGLEPVSSVMKKGGFRWFGHMERKDDTDWIKCCTVMEVE